MISLRIKRLFLSMAQEYFRDVPTGFQWDRDPKKTKIFIGDKYSAKVGAAEKYPAIILTSGSKRWARTSIDQRKLYPGFPLNKHYKQRADLVYGSVTYQCLSDNGVEANSIADVLFNMVIAFKDKMREQGIHQVLDVQIGEEQLVRSDNVARVFAVPVNITFVTQATLVTSSADYSLQVYTTFGNAFVQTLVGLEAMDSATMYAVSGANVVFNDPPSSGLTIYAKYVDGVTLEDVSETLGVANGVQFIWPLSSLPYSSYFILNNITYSDIAIDTNE